MDHVSKPATGGAKFVYFAFFVFGIAGLMPWNLFITGHSYFDYKLAANESELESGNGTRTYLQRTFESAFTISGSLVGLAGVIINAVAASRISHVKRMVCGFWLVMIALVPSTAFALIDTSTWQITFFVLTLILLNVANFASNGLISAASFGLAAKFPAQYMTAQLTGQAVAGVLTSLASILSQTSTPSPKWNGFAYFVCAFVFTGFSALLYWLMRRTEYYKWQTSHHRPDLEIVDDERQHLIESCTIVDSNDSPVPVQSTDQLVRVTRKMWYACVNSVLIYAVTLSCFPGLSSLVVSTSNNKTWAAYFIPVACFLTFNVADALGRVLGGYFKWPGPRSLWLITLSVVRIGLIMLVILCNIKPKMHVPTLIESDVVYAVLIMCVGLTNGHLITRACEGGVSLIADQDLEVGGAILAAFGVTGVAVGSALSFLLLSIV